MIGLISCSASKLIHPAAARELYTSALFRKSLAYAERRCTATYVLSAKHGLVELDRILEPYDQTLVQRSMRDRREWAREVSFRLDILHGDETSRDLRALEFLVLAGDAYVEPLRGELVGWFGVDAVNIHTPLERMQIGERLRFLKRELAGDQFVATRNAEVSID